MLTMVFFVPIDQVLASSQRMKMPEKCKVHLIYLSVKTNCLTWFHTALTKVNATEIQGHKPTES